MIRLLALSALLLSGCGYKLDPFLYTPDRTDAYVFAAEGSDPGSTVTPDRIEPLVIDESPQIRLGAVYVRANVSPPRAYVLFFHGKGDHLGNQFERAKRIANIGYDVLAIDYRGFGISTDITPTEAGIGEDTKAALEYLIARVGGSDRIIYYGHSFGTAVATQRAAADPPKVLILESGFASLAEFKTDSSLMDFPGEYIAQDSWATSRRIRDVHAPVLLMHGLADDFVRPQFSELLYANANDPKKLELVPGADHDTIAVTLGAGFGDLIHSWVDPYVPPP